MKRTVLAIALAVSQPAAALDLVPDNWTKADTAWELSYLAVAIADAGQTADIGNHEGLHEVNPLLPANPSKGQVAAYFAAAAAVHYGVSAALPPKYRRAWQAVTLTINGAVVAHNYSLGLRWGF